MPIYYGECFAKNQYELGFISLSFMSHASTQ